MREEIENIFQYHQPNSAQQRKYFDIRVLAKSLAYIIEESRDKTNELRTMIQEECPESREKEISLSKLEEPLTLKSLEEAVMWANASIARHK